MKLLGIGSEVCGGIVKMINKSEEKRLTIEDSNGTIKYVSKTEAEKLF